LAALGEILMLLPSQKRNRPGNLSSNDFVPSDRRKFGREAVAASVSQISSNHSSNSAGATLAGSGRQSFKSAAPQIDDRIHLYSMSSSVVKNVLDRVGVDANAGNSDLSNSALIDQLEI
jgi:hypothetical protein